MRRETCRASDGPSLSNVSTDLFKDLEVRRGFDTFGDEREVEGPGEFYGGTHDRARPPVDP